MSERRYDPKQIEPKWQELWAREGTWEVSNEPDEHRRRRQVLRARDAAVPERRAAHRAPEELRARRRDRALPSPHRPSRAAPDGLRRVRAAGREQRDQDRRAPPRRDQRSRSRPTATGFTAGGSRSTGRESSSTHEPSLLPLDAVDLPAAVRARPRLPQGGGGQVVPVRPDGARQRAGDRRPLRAVRQRGRGPPARAVVLPDHRLRRPPARRPRPDRLARARQGDAAQLDRPQRGRGGHVPLRGARDRLPGVHDPSRHAVRRDVLRDGTRAPGRVPARRRAPSTSTRSTSTSTTRSPSRVEDRGDGRQAEDRRPARPHGDQPGQRRADPDVRRRLRADGVRHRRDHGECRPTTSATTSSRPRSTCRSGTSWRRRTSTSCCTSRRSRPTRTTSG